MTLSEILIRDVARVTSIQQAVTTTTYSRKPTHTILRKKRKFSLTCSRTWFEFESIESIRAVLRNRPQVADRCPNEDADMWRVFGSKVGGSYRHGRDNRSKKRERGGEPPPPSPLQPGVPGVTCRSPEQCIAERYTRHAACLRVTLLNFAALSLSRFDSREKLVVRFPSYERCLGEPRY